MLYTQKDSLPNKTLSIIITAHNMQDYILDCMNSVISAVGEYITSCEMILINDASEDKTANIMTEFSKNKSITYLQTNFKNIGKVRNHAVSLCSGNYITMVDGDDILCRNALPKIISFLQEKKPDIYITPLYQFRGEIIKKKAQCALGKKTHQVNSKKSDKKFPDT